MNPDLTMPLVLQLVGVLVIIAEIIIPSGGILSIMAAGLIGYSLYTMFTQISTTAGGIILIGDAILIPILVYWGLRLIAKSPVTLRRSLSSRDGVTSQPRELEALAGRQGTTLTGLRPSGKARIAGRKIDVVSQGAFIEKGVTITVIAVTGNQVIVAPFSETAETV